MEITEKMVNWVANRALRRVLRQLAVGNLVTRDFEPVVGVGHDVVHVKVASMPEPTAVELDRHVEATFVVPDIHDAMQNETRMGMYIDPAAISVAERIELDLLNLFPRFTHQPVVGSVGEVLSAADLDVISAALANDESEQGYLAVGTAAYGELRKQPRFVACDQTNLLNGIPGPVGRLGNLLIFRSCMIPNTKAGVRNLAFTKSAACLATRRIPLPLPGCGAVADYAEVEDFGLRATLSYCPKTLGQMFSIDVLYGVSQLNVARAVRVIS